MKRKVIFIFIFSLLSFVLCMAQDIGKYNENGQKEGYWIEDWGNSLRVEFYYKNGKLDGLAKYINGRGILFTLGFFANDQYTGVWYHFNDRKGNLTYLQKDFEYDVMIEIDGHIYQNKCYCVDFHPNGAIEKEGYLLWNESPDSDDTYYYGEWKLYNEQGEFIKSETYE